jgi:hypothetical protein
MASGFLAFEDEAAAGHRTLGFRDLADINRRHAVTAALEKIPRPRKRRGV